MSIASEIIRINNNIAAAYVECEAKSAEMPGILNSANLAECIASIREGLSHMVVGDFLVFFYGESISSNTIIIANSTVSGNTIDIG